MKIRYLYNILCFVLAVCSGLQSFQIKSNLDREYVLIGGVHIELTCKELMIINPNVELYPAFNKEIILNDSLSNSDIEMLSKLTQLESLALINLGISDTDFLKSFTKLETLYIDNNRISNLEFLQELSNLKILSASWNPIENSHYINELSSIEYLDLSYTDINDLKDLPNSIISLSLQNVNVNHWEDLSLLTNIRYLDICKNNIIDISFINELKQLEYFYASFNSIEDISSIKNKNIKIIHMSGNNIKDYSPLYNLNSPEEMWMDFDDDELEYFELLYPNCIIMNYN
jgi:internalin A